MRLAAANRTARNVAVIGAAGRTGLAVLRRLALEGANIMAYDRQSDRDLRNALEREGVGEIEIQSGEAPRHLEQMALVILSPGVPIDAPYLETARKAGVPIWSEVEYAARQIQAPILAVTGTNGKSTTTTLLGKMLHEWGKKVFVGGNLGTPLVEAVGGTFDFVVAEISSFQLEAVDEFHPRIGVLLNLAPNHLDRHVTLERYGSLKARLFARMGEKDRAILNGDDPFCRELAKNLRCPVWTFSKESRGDLRANPSSLCLTDGVAVSLASWKLPGAHNLEDALAAAGAAHAIGCPASAMEKALASFRGLPHRLEEVLTFEGVRYVNDSKSTTPAAAAQALLSFDRPVIWLAGGRSKGTPYGDLGEVARKSAKTILLFGEAADAMAKEWPELRCRKTRTMAEAFEMARNEAKAGDIVLLSPANASFDEFSDYEERGRFFTALTLQLEGEES